jgi:hypothetical protein
MDSNIPDLHDFFDSTPVTERITRTNDLDLAFNGWLVASADITDYTRTRWTKVSLWMTTKRAYVAQITQGGTTLPTVSRAAARHSFEEIVEWMREDNRGQLGGASKKVIAVACDRLPWLEGEDVEQV